MRIQEPIADSPGPAFKILPFASLNICVCRTSEPEYCLQELKFSPRRSLSANTIFYRLFRKFSKVRNGSPCPEFDPVSAALILIDEPGILVDKVLLDFLPEVEDMDELETFLHHSGRVCQEVGSLDELKHFLGLR